MQCNIVEYISYNMGNRDLPDIYTLALGPAALGLRCIYQANPSCPCYNLYIHIYIYIYNIYKPGINHGCNIRNNYSAWVRFTPVLVDS